MPDRGAHVAQAEHNEALYSHLDQAAPEYADWQVTSLFYAALHYVDAYLANTASSVHPQTHQERDRLVSMERGLRRISIDYQELKDRSLDARYRVVRFPADFPDLLWANQFDRVRSHVRSVLGLPP